MASVRPLRFNYFESHFCCTGFLPLAELPIIRLIKGSQFRKFCIICIFVLVITIAITCVCHEEEERPRPRETNKCVHVTCIAQNNTYYLFLFRNGFREIIENIRVALINLPQPIRRVCFVQLFAFMGWYVRKTSPLKRVLIALF